MGLFFYLATIVRLSTVPCRVYLALPDAKPTALFGVYLPNTPHYAKWLSLINLSETLRSLPVSFALIFRLQSIRLYSIAILLRPAALCFTIRH